MSLHTLEQNGVKFTCSSNFKTLQDYAAYIYANIEKSMRLKNNTMTASYQIIVNKLKKAGL